MSSDNDVPLYAVAGKRADGAHRVLGRFREPQEACAVADLLHELGDRDAYVTLISRDDDAWAAE